jgi:thiamine biosynthesis lipoprotein ApbE
MATDPDRTAQNIDIPTSARIQADGAFDITAGPLVRLWRRSRNERALPTPEEIAKLVRGVINLEASDRIVLVLDPRELLTRAEQGLLDTFRSQRAQANA